MLHDPFTGQHLRFLKTGNQTGGQLLEVEVVLDPRGRVPRHVHLRQDKWVEVVEGALSIQLGGEQRRLTSGESVEMPRSTLQHVRAHEGRTRFCCRSARRAAWRPP
jgi:quercetin dioxygenase-like cupin family protein